MHLSKSTRFDGDMSSSDRLGNGEVLGVGDTDEATTGFLGLLVHHTVREVVLGLFDGLSRRLLVFNGARDSALEDILFALGDVCEDLGRKFEVLGDDGFGRVC